MYEVMYCHLATEHVTKQDREQFQIQYAAGNANLRHIQPD
jgi:hypothetical protein